ncbi:MAG TPA: MlaD family protein [Chthoniobacterales bacterium]|nr:MlaD family protein [Chthoniobacterales bacterium]
MQLRRNEILTGVLVIGTVAVIVGVLILLGAPGLFRPLVTYKIYFDNAAGIKLGAPVMLAGRKIGQVQELFSPVSQEENRRAQEIVASIRPGEPNETPASPESKPKFEVRINVLVDKNAIVYRDAHTRLMQLGLLGEMAIDITQGTEAAGRARNGDIFAGERTPDFSEAIAQMLEVIKPVATEATSTMKELQATAQNLNHITDNNSELNQALTQFKTFGEHLVELTAKNGSLTQSLDNIQEITEQLTKNDNLSVTLQNFRHSSEELKSTLRDLEPVGKNITEFSDTIKRQPWRLIFPTTKKYPETSPTPAEGTITVRKSTKARATPTPTQGNR